MGIGTGVVLAMYFVAPQMTMLNALAVSQGQGPNRRGINVAVSITLSASADAAYHCECNYNTNMCEGVLDGGAAVSTAVPRPATNQNYFRGPGFKTFAPPNLHQMRNINGFSASVDASLMVNVAGANINISGNVQATASAPVWGPLAAGPLPFNVTLTCP